MFEKQNFFIEQSRYKKNIKKTKKVFEILKNDLKNGEIPMLESYEKDYKLEFTKNLVKKYSKFKNIVIIGMGGSILGTQTIHSFLREKIKKKIFFFDNLDPSLNLKFKKIKNLKKTCFIVVSKSGNTLETITNLSTIFSKSLLKKRLIIITEIKDSHLMDFASFYDAEIIEHKEFIGGRYSVMSEASMFPAALMGLDIKKFKNLKKQIKNKKFASNLIKNVAGIYTLNLNNTKNSVILNYDSGLNSLGSWYQQLTAESLGKRKKGITPILSYGPKDHHSLLQLYLDGPKDKFFTFLSSNIKKSKFNIPINNLSPKMNFLKNKSLEFVINAQCEATKNIFELKKIPFRQLKISRKNEEELGKIFSFLVLETIMLARLMNVNPFDQPAVEQVKIETRKFLS
tara:strand:+ start:536 stop:1732 length:1197 start_codon:yes stop_codon:yes gene_type:complete